MCYCYGFHISKGWKHFDKAKGPSDHPGHLVLLTSSQEQKREGLLPRMRLQQGAAIVIVFKLRIIRKMFIPIRNKDIDRAMLETLKDPPGLLLCEVQKD